jgi:hypothetical protein
MTGVFWVWIQRATIFDEVVQRQRYDDGWIPVWIMDTTYIDTSMNDMKNEQEHSSEVEGVYSFPHR